jgi:osmotically-inducible protein OsmY
MKPLRFAATEASPSQVETRILDSIRASESCDARRLRVALAGHLIYLDGFVDDLREKSAAEMACRRCAPDLTVINRLRIAARETQGGPSLVRLPGTTTSKR